MAVSKKPFPRRDQEFNTLQRLIIQKAIPMIDKWHLDQKWMMETLVPAAQKWDMIWEQYKDPITRAPLIIFEKIKARQNYEPLLRMVIQSLEHNYSITDDELAEMDIRRRSHKYTLAPSPKSKPGCATKSNEHRVVKFNAFDIETRKRAKPEGVHSLEFRWAILVDRPKDVNELINSNSYTSNSFSMEFKETERWKTIYFCLRWENSRGVKGPWSDILSTIIP
jgi:hypothetical protein